MEFAGTFDELRDKLLPIDLRGEWLDLPNNVHRLRCEDRAGLMWAETTGTVWFDGPEKQREELKSRVAPILGEAPMATLAPMPLQAPPPTKHEILGDIRAIIETVDRHAREVNVAWGFNRLPHLVPIPLMEAFRRQKAKWELACFECAGSLSADDLARVRKHGEAMLRAFAKMGETAIEVGHMPAPPATWEFELQDGTPVVLVRDRAELSQVDLGNRKGQVWSLDEISDIVARFPDIARAKECFPGAEVIQLRTDPLVVGKLDDELSGLPF